MSLESTNQQHNYYHPLSVAASLNATKNSGHTFCVLVVCPKLCSYVCNVCIDTHPKELPGGGS
jgi:hypothetical protein